MSPLPSAVPMPECCADCGRKVRDPRIKATGDGTICYAGNGLCITCRSSYRRASERVRASIEYPDITPERNAWNAAGLDAYIADRRRRGVPADGWPVEGESPETVPEPTPIRSRAMRDMLRVLEMERAAVRTATREKEAREHLQAMGVPA